MIVMCSHCVVFGAVTGVVSDWLFFSCASERAADTRSRRPSEVSGVAKTKARTAPTGASSKGSGRASATVRKLLRHDVTSGVIICMLLSRDCS